MAPRILYVVTEDWYFLSHRLPMARAAKAGGLRGACRDQAEGRQGGHRAGRLRAPCARSGAGAACRRGAAFPPSSSCGACSRGEARHPAQHLLEARAARHRREPRPFRDRRGQQPDRARHALHRRGEGERHDASLGARCFVAALAAKAQPTVVQNPDDRAFVIGLGVPPSRSCSFQAPASTPISSRRCPSRRRRSPPPMSGACLPTRAW